MRGTPRRHYVHTKARGDLWVAHRTDRDRTTERIEVGERVYQALVAAKLEVDGFFPGKRADVESVRHSGLMTTPSNPTVLNSTTVRAGQTWAERGSDGATFVIVSAGGAGVTADFGGPTYTLAYDYLAHCDLVEDAD